MITISATVAGTAYVAVLPWVKGWAVRSPKPEVSRMSLAGTMIHQTSTKTVTAAQLTYSAMVPQAEAAKLDIIDRGVTTCTLSDGYNVYTVSLNAEVSKHVEGGRRQVDFTAQIISEPYAP